MSKPAYKFTPALLKRWTKALRSGKYLQAQSALRGPRHDDKIGYCCLGVLADVIDNKGWSKTGGSWKRRDTGCLGESRCGIPTPLQGILAAMNDGEISQPKTKKRYTFKSIARWLEKHTVVDGGKLKAKP